MATGRPLLPRMHSTLALGFLRADAAGDGGQGVVAQQALRGLRRGCPAESSSMNRGMFTITGQPAMHFGSLHWRQRSASSRATFSGKPRLTSSKLALRTSGVLLRHLLPVDLQALFGGDLGTVMMDVDGLKGCEPDEVSSSRSCRCPLRSAASGLLLEFAVGAQAVHQQVEIHQVAVELRAVHAGELASRRPRPPGSRRTCPCRPPSPG